jgi:hypothetical protein
MDPDPAGLPILKQIQLLRMQLERLERAVAFSKAPIPVKAVHPVRCMLISGVSHLLMPIQIAEMMYTQHLQPLAHSHAPPTVLFPTGQAGSRKRQHQDIICEPIHGTETSVLEPSEVMPQKKKIRCEHNSFDHCTFIQLSPRHSSAPQ